MTFFIFFLIWRWSRVWGAVIQCEHCWLHSCNLISALLRGDEEGCRGRPGFFPHVLEAFVAENFWYCLVWPESKRHRFVQLHWTFFDILHGEHQSGVTHDGRYSTRCDTVWAYRVHNSDRWSRANDRWTHADCNSLANVHVGLPPLEVEAAGWCGAQKSLHAASYLNSKLILTAYLSQRVCWIHFVMHQSSSILKTTALASAARWLTTTTTNPSPSQPPKREKRAFIIRSLKSMSHKLKVHSNCKTKLPKQLCHFPEHYRFHST